jgi:hypothetical protein
MKQLEKIILTVLLILLGYLLCYYTTVKVNPEEIASKAADKATDKFMTDEVNKKYANAEYKKIVEILEANGVKCQIP